MQTITIKIIDDLWDRAGRPKEDFEDTIRCYFLATDGLPEYQQVSINFKEE
jgi:hypothetical protein